MSFASTRSGSRFLDVGILGRVSVIVVPFLVGLLACSLGPRLTSRFFGGNVSTHAEESRVTSPDGTLDAVMIYESYGGAVGGIDWYAYIVRKGKTVSSGQKPVFGSDDLTGEKMVWKQPHLLEIRYDKADIEQFRNLWGLHEVEDVGPSGERDYGVEIRLAPSSDFSLLTPSGDFRSK
jgi:hypothetical protein